MIKTSSKIVILGSTGSIGRQAIEVISQNRDLFEVTALSAYKNTKLIYEQASEFDVSHVAVLDDESAVELNKSNPPFKVLTGKNSLLELASFENADTVLNSLVGSLGLEATVTALNHGKKLALANKESMVAGGQIIRNLNRNDLIIPVDSEHSAIYQLLLGEDREEVESLIITGSGGPFRDKTVKEMEDATIDTALKHPRWKMGPKITIDSATLMNKGLEVIEAHYLFDIPYEKIKVVIHPQSIIHSMVQFRDGSVKAHLGQTDMRIPILYAFSYPKRLESPLPFLDWSKDVQKLEFEEVDFNKFKALKLSFQAGEAGRTYPVVLNAANEVAVAAFLRGTIKLTDIAKIVEEVISKHEPFDADTLKAVKEADNWGKERARAVISQ